MAAIFEMVAILNFFPVCTISNIDQYINIYQYATFNAVWPDISVISVLNGTKPVGLVAAIFEMASMLYSFSVGTISNIVQHTNIYHYATFDAVWPDISMISLLNGTKPGRTRDGMELCRVAAIFKMAAILDCF